MKTIKGKRSHSGFLAGWPVTYWNDEVFGQGTVLNLSNAGCRMAGTMTVEEGARLTLWISPPTKEDVLCIDEARVMWVHGHQFGVEFRSMAVIDQRELAAFLHDVERRQKSLQPSCSGDGPVSPVAA
jgi:PilZ domain